MIEHIVSFKLDTERIGSTHLIDQHFQLIKNSLESLTEQISVLNSMRVIINENQHEGETFVLIATVDGYDELKAYSIHEAHVEVVQRLIVPYVLSRVCIDHKV